MPTPSIAASATASAQVVHAAASSAPSIASVVAVPLGWLENGSLSFELVKGLPTTLVAIVVAFIAWRQYRVAIEQKRVARAKLNLDLFERRLKIFQATEQFLLNSFPGASKGKTDFIHLFAEASFLFESEVEAYMQSVLKKCGELRTIELRAAANNQMVRPDDIARDTELVKWVTDEHGGGCRRVFAPYLDFTEWR